MIAWEVFYLHPHFGKVVSEIVYTNGEIPALRIPSTFRREDLDEIKI